MSEPRRNAHYEPLEEYNPLFPQAVTESPMTNPDPAPSVAIVMGSRSDWDTMKAAAEQLDALEVPYLAQVVSAHRTPDLMAEFARSARDRGIRCLIAGAGGAAHLPGMLAAMTPLPVLGVPINATALQGWDSLLSIVQMPKGIPVATFAVGAPGAANAALFAAAILAGEDPDLAERLDAFRDAQTRSVLEQKLD